MSGSFRNPRPPAVAGAFYPADPHEIADMIDAQLAYARTLLGDKSGGQHDSMADADGIVAPRHPAPADDASAAVSAGAELTARPWPKAIIVPHAGYVYSGTTAALAYALLTPGRGTIRRAVIVGPTHRVAVRGVACPTYDAFRTPLGTVSVDVPAECRALGLALSNPEVVPPNAGGSGGACGAAPTLHLRSGMTAVPGAPAPALSVNDPTHVQEHAVEVQIPFLQRVLGDIEIIPLNAGLATSGQVGDVLRALWGGPETVIVISSDLSHYHRERIARRIDDETIRRITALDYPIDPDYACGAYPINGILDVLARGVTRSPVHGASASAVSRMAADVVSSGTDPIPVPRDDVFQPGTSDTALRLEFLGCSTSGDNGVVALAGQERPAMVDPDDRVVGYASWAVWEENVGSGRVSSGAVRGAVPESSAGRNAERDILTAQDTACASAEGGRGDGEDSRPTARAAMDSASEHGATLLEVARAALRAHLGLPVGRTPADIVAAHPWLNEPGASFVTLNKHGELRGCIGTLEAYRSLGRDVAAHAVDAATHDPRFPAVTPDEYLDLDIEVSVLSPPKPIMVAPASDTDDRGGKPDHPSDVGIDGAHDSLHPVRSRAELERALHPGRDGLIIEDRSGHHRATFLPQVWEDLPEPHRFVAHLLAKAGLPASTDWRDGEIHCSRYTVAAYHGRADT